MGVHFSHDSPGRQKVRVKDGLDTREDHLTAAERDVFKRVFKSIIIKTKGVETAAPVA